MVCVIANGREERLGSSISIADFLDRKGLKPAQAIVAVNSDVIAVEQYENTMLVDGDVLDVMSFVGGG